MEIIAKDKTENLLLLDGMQKQLDELRKLLLTENVETDKGVFQREFSSLMSWKEKILYMLEYHKKPLPASEMISFLEYHDTVFQYKRNYLEKHKMLSTQLCRLFSAGLIEREKRTGQRGFYYTINNV